MTLNMSESSSPISSENVLEIQDFVTGDWYQYRKVKSVVFTLIRTLIHTLIPYFNWLPLVTIQNGHHVSSFNMVSSSSCNL